MNCKKFHVKDQKRKEYFKSALHCTDYRKSDLCTVFPEMKLRGCQPNRQTDPGNI